MFTTPRTAAARAPGHVAHFVFTPVVHGQGFT
jgi:hypothetical protein